MNMNLLDQWKDEYLSQDETYRNHVTKFVAFINNIEKANQPITITKEDLIESVGYYHRLGKIKTIKTMESHVESVKAFYKYIVGKGYADDIFNNTASFQEFKTFIINKYNLTGVKDKDFWEADMIIEILENLDDYFERTNYSELDSRSKKRFFKFLVLRLFIKLTLIAPAKKSVIVSICRKNFSNDYRLVEVNSVQINIPTGLYRDLRFSIQIAEKTRNKAFLEDDKILEFIYCDNFRIESLNEFFCLFLKSYNLIAIDKDVESYPVEPIMDAALFNMVVNGSNPALISKINGVKISSLEKKF